MRKITLDIHSNIKKEVIDHIVEDKFINLSSLTNAIIYKMVYNAEDYFKDKSSLNGEKPNPNEEYTSLDVFYPKEPTINYPTDPLDNLTYRLTEDSKNTDPKYRIMVENLIRSELYDLFINYDSAKMLKMFVYGISNLQRNKKYGGKPLDIFFNNSTFKDKDFLNDFKKKYSDSEINKIIYDVLGYMLRRRDIRTLDWLDRSIKFVTDDDKKIINSEEYNVIKLKGEGLKFLEVFSCESSIDKNALVGGVLRYIESNPEVLEVRSMCTANGRSSVDTKISVDARLFFNDLEIGGYMDEILKEVLYSVDDFKKFKEYFRKNYTKIRMKRSDKIEMPLYERNVFYSWILKDLKEFKTEVGVRWNDIFTYMKKYVEEEMVKNG